MLKTYHGSCHCKSDERNMVDDRATPSVWLEGHIHHYFCKRCGVQVFSKGYLELDQDIFNGWFYAVNLATIEDITPQEIIAAPVIYEDGSHDRQIERQEGTRRL